MGNGPCQSNTMSFFCLLNQSCHQSKHRDGMENRLRMTDRIWEWNTATRPPPNPGQALPISKSPSPHPNPLLGVSLWAQLDAQKGGGDPSVTQGHPGDGTGGSEPLWRVQSCLCSSLLLGTGSNCLLLTSPCSVAQVTLSRQVLQANF